MDVAPLDDPRAFMEWLVKRAGSQSELARRSGILVSQVSDYVRAENEPKLTNVLKLLRAVNIRIEGMPDRPDPTEETLEVVKRLEQYLLGGRDAPPTASGDA